MLCRVEIEKVKQHQLFEILAEIDNFDYDEKII